MSSYLTSFLYECGPERRIFRITAIRFALLAITQSRKVTKELNNPLKNFTAPFVLSFGAWLDKGDIHLAFGKMEGYNEAVFNANILVIEKIARETIALLKSVVE